MLIGYYQRRPCFVLPQRRWASPQQCTDRGVTCAQAAWQQRASMAGVHTVGSATFGLTALLSGLCWERRCTVGNTVLHFCTAPRISEAHVLLMQHRRWLSVWLTLICADCVVYRCWLAFIGSDQSVSLNADCLLSSCCHHLFPNHDSRELSQLSNLSGAPRWPRGQWTRFAVCRGFNSVSAALTQYSVLCRPVNQVMESLCIIQLCQWLGWQRSQAQQGVHTCRHMISERRPSSIPSKGCDCVCGCRL